MDRKSWLWRRKSSEKSPSGETESSGSISSHSERFFDDQALSNHNVQSPEVTSKAPQSDEHDDTVKTLSEKLSEALLNIRAKDDLVKQHSKVAEEAVSGWEKAENEVLALKIQNDTLTHKNSILNERIDHLDGALKECLRQLRQSRDEQEEKIQEWESNKSELENRIAKLQTQLHLAKTDTNDALLVDIRSKLEASEKENSILKLKLVTISKELDLSTHAAETASKQHLDSIKKVAKLESECLRLKVMARKANDSYSDSGSFKASEESININNNNNNSIGKSPFGPSDEIDLMDDFLEMERLVAIPETRVSGESVELEEKLKKVTAEKVSLEIALNECQMQLNVSEDRIGQTMAKLVDMKMKLAVADEAKRGAEKEVESMRVKLKDLTKLLGEKESTLLRNQNRLTEADEAKKEVESMKVKLKGLTKLLDEKELALVQSQDRLTKAEKAKRRAEEELEDTKADEAKKEVESMKVKLKGLTKLLDEKELTLVQSQDRLTKAEEAKRRAEAELEDTKADEAKKEVESMKVKLKGLTKLLDEKELTLVQSQDRLTKAEEAKRRAEAELEDTKAEGESKIMGMENKLEKLRSGIFSLEKEIEREKSFSREAVEKCNVLEAEISRRKSDSDSYVQRSTIVEEFRINQDKELAVAASKFAECQKTIASLDRQLKSLATLEDFMIDDE